MNNLIMPDIVKLKWHHRFYNPTFFYISIDYRIINAIFRFFDTEQIILISSTVQNSETIIGRN